MNYRFFALLGTVALCLSSIVQAQDYDDIYYNESSKPKKTAKTKVATTSKSTTIDITGPAFIEIVNNGGATNVVSTSEWDVDAYNRRGAEYESNYASTDSTENDMFANTQRIERFHNPDIVVKSNDDELLELYFETTPTVNLIVANPVTTIVDYGWRPAWYAWDPFYYTPYYDYYYRPWGWYSTWHWGWRDPWCWRVGWSWHYGWSRPWHGGWAWNRPWRDNWGWRHRGSWDRPGYHANWGHQTRRPTSRFGTSRGNEGRMSTYGSTGRRGVSGNVSGRTPGGMNNGRPRPSTEGGMNNGRRPASSIGNMGTMNNGRSRSTRDITTRSVTSSQRSDSYSRSSNSSSSRVDYGRTPSSRSEGSRSYSGSSSRSYGGGSSSHSYGGGGSRGGGFSGGGHSGGGGGGGRRH